MEVLVFEDPWHETDEDVDFLVTVVSGARIGAQDTTQMVIVDDDPLTLYVEIDRDEMPEQSGSSTANAYRNTTVGELTVDLASSNTTEATVPATVTFADGEFTAPFTVTAKDDDDQDDTQTITVTASKAGYVDGVDTIDVTDNESPGFAPGNLLVTTYPSSDEDQISEYTLSGTLVQDITFNHGGDDLIRDIIVDRDRLVQIYSGTFEPSLTTLQVATKTTQDHTVAGWSTANNATYGGIAALGQYVFVTDMRTAAPGEPQGIIRFDIANQTAVRFAEAYEFLDLTIGHDGLLYGLADNDDQHVRRFHPYGLNELQPIALPYDSNRARILA